MLSKKQAFDQLVLETFRFHALLIAEGDRLTRDIGLTSARWQVLGAIAKAEAPSSLSDVARAMGLSRQGVQRLVSELEGEGLVKTRAHPTNRRSRIVTLTAAGTAAHDAANARQVPWAEALSRDLPRDHITIAVEIVRDLRMRLEAAQED